jgi:hypothetical protein
MKRIKQLAAVASALSLLAMSAGAATYWDYDSINQTLSGKGDFYQSDFNIADAGYNPTTETVNWFEVWFKIYDNDSSDEYGKFKLGIGDWETPWLELDTDTYHYSFNSGSVLANLDVDGILPYRIELGNDNDCDNDVKVKWAKLKAYTSARPNSNVPDGGSSLALLGVGLLGMAGLGRKLTH